MVYLESQIDACQSHWHNVIKNLQNKLAPLTEAIATANAGADTEAVMCEQLSQYLITGEASEQLAQFLSKEVYDCKIIPKLDDVRDER